MLRILFFSWARSLAGVAEISLPLYEASCPAALWRCLIQRFPEFATLRETARVARNCEFVSEEDSFSDGDEIAIIPPVSGG